MAHTLLFAITLAFDRNLEEAEANHNVNANVSSCITTISFYHVRLADCQPVLTSALLMALKNLPHLQGHIVVQFVALRSSLT